MTAFPDKEVIVASKLQKPSDHIRQVFAPDNSSSAPGRSGSYVRLASSSQGELETETRQVLLNLQNVLESAGVNLNSVVKTTVFLRDINDFAKMNAVYAEFFTDKPPARSTVAVAALPKGALVEIEAIAVIPQPGGD